MVVNVTMGDWMLKMKNYMTGYDSIIGVPILEAGGAVIDIRNRKVHFQEWDVTFDCTIPSEPPKRPSFKKQGLKQRAATKGSVGKKDRDLDREVPELVPIDPEPATAVATVAPAPVTVATIEATSSQQVPTNVRTDGDAEYYRSLLLKECTDVLVDNLPNELPLLHEINHHIPYKPTKPWVVYKYQLLEMHMKALEKDFILKLESGILRYTLEIPLTASHVCWILYHVWLKV